MAQGPVLLKAEIPFTIRDATSRGAEFLQRKGILTARLDAELLIGKAVAMDRLQLYLNMDRPIDNAERIAARELLQRRASREPVAYILGCREFRSRTFAVNKAVLIPRPETELLVEFSIQELKKRFPNESNLRILEFGVGSGVIAVSLAAEMPQACIVATEKSPEAAEVAIRNVQTHAVKERVEIRVQSDFKDIGGLFHAIVSNPPYIDPADRESLEKDVSEFEPEMALFAENAGMASIEFLIEKAPLLLSPNGFLIMEIGAGMLDRVLSAAEQGMRMERVIKDYSGIERVVMFTPHHGSNSES